MVILFPLAGAIAGVILGSFLATLILRWPDGERVPSGRSRCDHCGRILGAIDLVPILSSFVQRGRCRTCGGEIDPLHRQVELGCAAIGAVSLLVAPTGAGLALAAFGWLLVPLAVLDWRHQWLPDPLNLLLGASGLAIGGFLGASLVDRAIGMIVGYIALASIAAVYRAVRKREGLGGGDPKLMGAVGAWVGWVPLAPIIALAACLGLAIALSRRLPRQAALPFGTMIAPAAWLAAAGMLLRG